MERRDFLKGLVTATPLLHIPPLINSLLPAKKEKVDIPCLKDFELEEHSDFYIFDLAEQRIKIENYPILIHKTNQFKSGIGYTSLNDELSEMYDMYYVLENNLIKKHFDSVKRKKFKYVSYILFLFDDGQQLLSAPYAIFCNHRPNKIEIIS